MAHPVQMRLDLICTTSVYLRPFWSVKKGQAEAHPLGILDERVGGYSVASPVSFD